MRTTGQGVNYNAWNDGEQLFGLLLWYFYKNTGFGSRNGKQEAVQVGSKPDRKKEQEWDI